MGADSGQKAKKRRNSRDAQKQLEEWKAKFEVLFDHVSSGVAIYEAVNEGEDFIFVDFNPAAENIEHIKKEELIGKSVTEIFPGERRTSRVGFIEPDPEIAEDVPYDIVVSGRAPSRERF